MAHLPRRIHLPRRDGTVVAIVAVLFVAVLALRWSLPSATTAVAVLYAAPVALLAGRFGVRAGFGAALLACAMTFGWSVFNNGYLDPLALTIRFALFLGTGIAAGLGAEGFHRVAEESRGLQVAHENAVQRGKLAEQLQAVVGGLSRAATPQEVAQAYVTGGVPLLGFSRGGVFVLDRTGTTLSLVAVHRPVRPLTAWRAVPVTAHTPPSDAVRTGQANYQRTVDEIVAAYPDLADVRERSGDQAWVAVPMFGSQGVIGAVTAAFEAPRDFAPGERELLAAVTDRVAEAMERAQLLEKASQERGRAEASERRASLLADVGAVLTTDLGSAERMQRLLDLLVPGFADMGTVEVFADRGLEPIAAGHVDPELAPGLLDLRRHLTRGQSDDRLLLPAVRSGRATLRRLLSGTAPVRVPTDAEPEPVPDALRPRSALAVPLRARGTVIGGLLLMHSVSGREYGQADLALAELFAGRAALALDNARLFEQQRAVASTLQHSLLPEDLPWLPGVTATARYLPGETALDVGGDWYDVFALPRDRTGIALGDVVGQGVAAAATMGRLRSAVAALAPYCSGPAELLHRLDRFAASVPGAALATVAYAEYDPLTGVLGYACAGHPPPFLLTADGEGRFLGGGRNVPLGTGSGLPWTQDEVTLDSSAMLVCYSDGLVERRGTHLDVRLGQLGDTVVELRKEELDDLCESLLGRMIAGSRLSDDVALLCLRLERFPEGGFRDAITADRNELTGLRHRLRGWAVGVGLDKAQVADLLLATGEACANAVEHAYLGSRSEGHVDVWAHREPDGTVVVTVSDTGSWRSEPHGIEYRGLGLRLIRATVGAVEIDSRPSGTTVTMRTPPREQRPAPVAPGEGGTAPSSR